MPTKELITAAQLAEIAGPVPAKKRAKQKLIIERLADCINLFGHLYGFKDPAILAKFLGQLAVESDSFCTTTEYASGAAYEGRRDLGNVNPGDGKRFKGRGLIQTTGRNNYIAFTAWARKVLAALIKEPIPDFVQNPAELAKFPYAFFSAAFYWHQGNPTGKSLNRYATDNNDEMLTRRINGGLNHFEKRLDFTVRASLVLLGFDPDDVIGFQQKHPTLAGAADGIVGRKTRTALHMKLEDLGDDLERAREREIEEALDEIGKSIILPEMTPHIPAPRPALDKGSLLLRFFEWLATLLTVRKR